MTDTQHLIAEERRLRVTALVERLRERHPFHPIYVEAADALEACHAENERLREDARQWRQRALVDDKAEIERLREALEACQADRETDIEMTKRLRADFREQVARAEKAEAALKEKDT